MRAHSTGVRNSVARLSTHDVSDLYAERRGSYLDGFRSHAWPRAGWPPTSSRRFAGRVYGKYRFDGCLPNHIARATVPNQRGLADRLANFRRSAHQSYSQHRHNGPTNSVRWRGYPIASRPTCPRKARCVHHHLIGWNGLTHQIPNEMADDFPGDMALPLR